MMKQKPEQTESEIVAEKILKAHEEQKRFRFTGRISVIKKALLLLKKQGKMKEENAK